MEFPRYLFLSPFPTLLAQCSLCQCPRGLNTSPGRDELVHSGTQCCTWTIMLIQLRQLCSEAAVQTRMCVEPAQLRAHDVITSHRGGVVSRFIDESMGAVWQEVCDISYWLIAACRCSKKEEVGRASGSRAQLTADFENVCPITWDSEELRNVVRYKV